MINKQALILLCKLCNIYSIGIYSTVSQFIYFNMEWLIVWRKTKGTFGDPMTEDIG